MAKLFNHFLIAFKLSHLYSQIGVFSIYQFLHCCLGFQGHPPGFVS